MRLDETPLWVTVTATLAVFGLVGGTAGFIALRLTRRGWRFAVVAPLMVAALWVLWSVVGIVVEQVAYRVHVAEVNARQGPATVVVDRRLGPLLIEHGVSWETTTRSSSVAAMHLEWSPGEAAVGGGVFCAISLVFAGSLWWLGTRGRGSGH